MVSIGVSLTVVLLAGGANDQQQMFMGDIPPLGFSKYGEHTYVTERLVGCSNFNDPTTNERELSNNFFTQAPKEEIPDSRGLSSWACFWFQFGAHDLTLQKPDPEQPTATIAFNENINMTLVPVCFVLDSENCKLPKTFISPAADGTNIYGDYRDEERAKSLREGAFGRLKITEAGFLFRDPQNPTHFLAGDIRSSEHAILSTIHTLFVREHNKIAGELHELMPTWNDDQLFWKAKQINVAKYQRIFYEEALPAIFGHTAFQNYLVNPSSLISGTGLMISTEFSNAAFRYGHSMVPNNVGKFPLKKLFFNASFVEENGIESFILEAQKTPSQKVDIKVVDGLRNILFGDFGHDLVTRNLYNGRNLQLGTYQMIADAYGFPAVTNATDAFMGLLSEPIMPGSSLPRGIATIVGEQFHRTFNNDPNFYLHIKEEIGAHFYEHVSSTTFKDIVLRNTHLTEADLPENMFFVSQ